MIEIDDKIKIDDEIEADDEMDNPVKNPHNRDTRKAQHQKLLLFPPIESLTTDL